MELKMINLKILSAAAAIALVLPLVTPDSSFAQAPPGGGGRAGGAAVGGGGARGGGAAMGGGGGFRGGGAAIGGGGFRGGGAAMAPGGGGFRGGGFAATGRSAIAAPPGGRYAGSPTTGVAPGGSRWAGGNWAGRGNWQGRHHHHRGGGFWPGVAIGAGIGSSYAYYGSGYDPYYYDDGYYDDSTVAVAPEGGDASYCAQRYRSYDPASGTYLGYDGQRHPCP
jgi:BA14K-like protein